jgi:hypothetical protein
MQGESLAAASQSMLSNQMQLQDRVDKQLSVAFSLAVGSFHDNLFHSSFPSSPCAN